jgi:hypothetical protein
LSLLEVLPPGRTKSLPIATSASPRAFVAKGPRRQRVWPTRRGTPGPGEQIPLNRIPS